MMFDGELSQRGMPLPEFGITLILTSKSNQFIFIPKYTRLLNLVKYPSSL